MAGLIRFPGWTHLNAAASRPLTRRTSLNPRKLASPPGCCPASGASPEQWCPPGVEHNGNISTPGRRLLRAAEELGYQVNFLAQGLNRPAQPLGVIVSRISDPFRSTLLDAL